MGYVSTFVLSDDDDDDDVDDDGVFLYDK